MGEGKGLSDVARVTMFWDFCNLQLNLFTLTVCSSTVVVNVGRVTDSAAT